MITCPSCSRFVYSRTSGICPECKAPLPPELRLTDAEKKEHEAEGENFRRMVIDLRDQAEKKGGLKRLFS